MGMRKQICHPLRCKCKSAEAVISPYFPTSAQMPPDILQPRRWLNKRRARISSKFINDTVWLSFTRRRWNNLRVDGGYERAPRWLRRRQPQGVGLRSGIIAFGLRCMCENAQDTTKRRGKKKFWVQDRLITRNKIFFILWNVYRHILFILSLEMTDFRSPSPLFELLLPLLRSPGTGVPLTERWVTESARCFVRLDVAWHCLEPIRTHTFQSCYLWK